MRSACSRWADAPLQWRSMTPDDVYRTLCDVIRLMSDGENESEQGSAWLRDPQESLDEVFLRLDFDAEKPEEFKALLEFVFHATLPMTSRFEAMLSSPEQFTINELCQCLAHDLAKPAVEPARILGKESHEAAIFRILRRRLAEMGAEVAGIKPSSRLEPYLQQHGEGLWLFASRLAPGRLAERVKAVPYPITRLIDLVVVWMWLSGFGCVVAWGFKSFLFVPAIVGPLGLVALGVAMILSLVGSRIPPRGYRWGEMETFADACCAIASGRRASRA